MRAPRTVIILLGIAIILVASGLGYWLSLRVEHRATPPPGGPAGEGAASPAVVVEPTPSLSPASAEASPFSEASGDKPAGLRPSPTPAARGAATATHPTLTLEALPAVIRSGTALRVRWTLRGPEGTRGTSTRLIAELPGADRQESAPITSFALPARFESTVVVTGRGTLRLVAEAVLDGNILRAQQTMRVE